VNKFKNSNRYGRPIHVSSLYKFRLPKFDMPAAPLPYNVLYNRLSTLVMYNGFCADFSLLLVIFYCVLLFS